MLRSWCALGSTSVAATMSFALGGMRIAAGGRRDHGSPAIHRQRNAYDAALREIAASRGTDAARVAGQSLPFK